MQQTSSCYHKAYWTFQTTGECSLGRRKVSKKVQCSLLPMPITSSLMSTMFEPSVLLDWRTSSWARSHRLPPNSRYGNGNNPQLHSTWKMLLNNLAIGWCKVVSLDLNTGTNGHTRSALYIDTQRHAAPGPA